MIWTWIRWHEIIELSCQDSNSLLDDLNMSTNNLECEPNIILCMILNITKITKRFYVTY